MTGVDRVVIIGGGIAGVSTAAALRDGGFDGTLTLVDTGDVPYDRPPLSKNYLSGSADLKQIALQTPEWYDDNAIGLRTHTTVAALRPSAGGVELADGSVLHADRVVLATGGSAVRPSIPGVDSPRVHVLRTCDDADRLGRALLPGARILIVGAGLIGAEVASTAVDLGCAVTLVDPVGTPLAAAVGIEVATWLHELHSTRGVTTLTAGVEGFVDRRDGVAATLSGESEQRVFDAVVLGVGMIPETSLAETANLAVDRGIIVGVDRVTSHPHVLAVGDPIRIRHGDAVGSRAEHWDAARHDGACAAATILRAPHPASAAPWFWTDRHHRHIEVVGRMSDADFVVARGELGDAQFAAFGICGGRVVGAVAVDAPNTVRAARRMIDRAITVDPELLGDTETDLRKLLRAAH